MRPAPYYAPTPCNAHAWNAMTEMMTLLTARRGSLVDDGFVNQCRHAVAEQLTADYGTRYEMRALMATAMEAGSAYLGHHDGFEYLNTFHPNSARAEILKHMGADQGAQYLKNSSYCSQSDAGYLLCYMGTYGYNCIDKLVGYQVPIFSTWFNGWGEGHYFSFYVHGWMFGGSETFATNNYCRSQIFIGLSSSRRSAVFGYMTSSQKSGLYYSGCPGIQTVLESYGYNTGGGGGGGEEPE